MLPRHACFLISAVSPAGGLASQRVAPDLQRSEAHSGGHHPWDETWEDQAALARCQCAVSRDAGACLGANRTPRVHRQDPMSFEIEPTAPLLGGARPRLKRTERVITVPFRALCVAFGFLAGTWLGERVLKTPPPLIGAALLIQGFHQGESAAAAAAASASQPPADGIPGFSRIGMGELKGNDVPYGAQPGNVSTAECASVCLADTKCAGFTWYKRPTWSVVSECYLKTPGSACAAVSGELAASPLLRPRKDRPRVVLYPAPATESWRAVDRCGRWQDDSCASAHSSTPRGEDVALVPLLRAITGRRPGTFVEVRGASEGPMAEQGARGGVYSQSEMLTYCFGWRGIRAEGSAEAARAVSARQAAGLSYQNSSILHAQLCPRRTTRLVAGREVACAPIAHLMGEASLRGATLLAVAAETAASIGAALDTLTAADLARFAVVVLERPHGRPSSVDEGREMKIESKLGAAGHLRPPQRWRRKGNAEHLSIYVRRDVLRAIESLPSSGSR